MASAVGNNSRYESGYCGAVTITPATTPLVTSGGNPFVTGALYVGSGGNITVMMQSGDIAIFTSVVSGTLLPICVQQVFASGTTASNMLGLV